MPEQDHEILSDDEAARLWERAAQLQVEAAQRIEAPVAESKGSSKEGHALTNVRSAAVEAGIGNEFVDAALADLRTSKAVPTKKTSTFVRRFLKHPPDTITVRRVIDATPQEVMTAMQAVFPEEPFVLGLKDQQGDPLNGGMLVFGIPGLSALMPKGFAYDAGEGGLKEVYVSLRPINKPTPSCEMTVRSPVTSHNLGFGIGMFFTTIAGGAGLGLGVLAATGLGALGLATGLLPIVAIGGVLTGGGLGRKGYRALYAYAMRKGREALDGLTKAVAVRVKGVWLKS